MVGQASARLSRKHFRVITVLCRRGLPHSQAGVIDRLGIFRRLRYQTWNFRNVKLENENLIASCLICGARSGGWDTMKIRNPGK